MIAKSELRSYDKWAGGLILGSTVVGAFSGVMLGNWKIFDIMYDEITLILVFLILMYRLVIAVENYVFEQQ